MSEAKKINEGTVTSLSDTDLVLASDSSGTLRPISVAGLLSLVRSNIQVGGRNLILNSVEFSGWSIKSGGVSVDGTYGIFTVRKAEGEWKGMYKIIDFEEGNYYTFSVYASTLTAALYMNYSNLSIPLSSNAAFGPSTTSHRTIGNGWHQIAVSAKCIKSGKAIIEMENQNTSVSTRFCAPKLERGNVATDWTPAPEDLGWGGVNVRYTTTYNSTADSVQKGGQRERSISSERAVQKRSHGYLSFGSLDAVCEYIGRAVELGGLQITARSGSYGQPRRHYRHISASADGGSGELSCTEQRFLLPHASPLEKLCFPSGDEYPGSKDSIPDKGAGNMVWVVSDHRLRQVAVAPVRRKEVAHV